MAAKDDKGKRIVSEGRVTRVFENGTEYGFLLNVPADAKALDLNFALHKSRCVEFVVKPFKPSVN
ncbi:MAG: hypothetical protein AB1757_28550 [Acidobacteriota bacterium]